MKVGDLVRDKLTKEDNTVGIVISILKPERHQLSALVEVLTAGRTHQWGAHRLEVISESR